MYLIKFSKQADEDKKLLKGARLDGVMFPTKCENI